VTGTDQERSEETRLRILQATYDCVARWGLAKTTVEDAAREAGVSRATVYRYFPGGRGELVNAVVAWEYARFFERLYEEVHTAGSLEEVMERGLVFAHRAIRDHEVLQRILETEPEVLLPTLTVESTGTQTLIAAVLVPYLERHALAPGVDIEMAADFLARMVLSYIASPGRWDLEDPEQVARLVKAELLAGIVPVDASAPAPAPAEPVNRRPPDGQGGTPRPSRSRDRGSPRPVRRRAR
jgi:AcrR family transcriptional regulator